MANDTGSRVDQPDQLVTIPDLPFGAPPAPAMQEHLKGIKHDHGKDRWDLIPWPELQSIVKVISHGAVKYGDCNWRHVPGGTERYFAATMRHITAWRNGENIDQESGLPHLAHAACSILFLMALDKQLNDKVGERYP